MQFMFHVQVSSDGTLHHRQGTVEVAGVPGSQGHAPGQEEEFAVEEVGAFSMQVQSVPHLQVNHLQ